MITPLLLLVAGLALVVQGGSLFVAAAVRLAAFLRLPRLVIGTTLVSLATTMPELVVSITAGLRGESGMAVGNAVGSCLCNTGLILGVTAMLRRVTVDPRALRLPLIAMSGLAILLLLMTLDLSLDRWQGAVLVVLGLAWFVRDFHSHWKARDRAAAAEATAEAADAAAIGRGWFRTRPGTIVQFLVGAAVVAVGSRLLVDGAVRIAAALAVPGLVIGLTVIAVGTSLPEFITAIASSRRAAGDLAVGNVLGANIANLTLIVGTAALFGGVTMDRLTQLLSFPVLLLFFALLLYRLLRGHDLTKREGALLLGGYLACLAALVVISLRH